MPVLERYRKGHIVKINCSADLQAIKRTNARGSLHLYTTLWWEDNRNARVRSSTIKDIQKWTVWLKMSDCKMEYAIRKYWQKLLQDNVKSKWLGDYSKQRDVFVCLFVCLFFFCLFVCLLVCLLFIALSRDFLSYVDVIITEEGIQTRHSCGTINEATPTVSHRKRF